MTALSLDEKLDRLMQGNREFVSSLSPPSLERWKGAPDRRVTAAVLACFDMEPGPEIVFGSTTELLVFQSPGPRAGDAEIEGLRFAHERFGLDLALVLSHAPCRFARWCADTDPEAFRGLGRSLQRSWAAAGDPPPDVPEREHRARAHAGHTAADVARRLRLPEVTVVPAHFDGRTGRVQLLG